MNATPAATITKADLTERKRGKGGSVVRLTDGQIVVVKDLMQRKTYDKPNRIGVGLTGTGLTFGVWLWDVEKVIG